MIKGNENKNSGIRQGDDVSFKHYQIFVKLFCEEQTEHHPLEIFTTGPRQLLEMRRIYARTYKKVNVRSIYNVMKNN